MRFQAEGHDRPPPEADRKATSAITEALGRLHVSGAIFLRGEYTEDWAYESLPPSDALAVLAPGAKGVLFFHVVAAGRCWISTLDGDRLWADAGDVIVLPYGDAHRMGGVGTAECVPIASLIDNPPWEQMPVIRYGGGGSETQIVCGYLLCDDALFDPRLRVMPEVFVVRPTGSARHWVKASVDYALEQTAPVQPNRIEGPPKIPELLLTEVLKIHLAGAPASDLGLLRALHDPVLAPVLAAIHSAPGEKWNLITLARKASVSVSLLDEKFRDVLGMAPIPLPDRLANAHCQRPTAIERTQRQCNRAPGRL